MVQLNKKTIAFFSYVMGNRGLESALIQLHGKRVGQLRDELEEILDTLFFFGPYRKNIDKSFLEDLHLKRKQKEFATGFLK